MIFKDLAEFVLGAPHVPESALDFTATLLVDTLGVTAGSARLDAARIARDHAVRFHAAGTPTEAATLLFDGRKASIPGAAFAAATQTDNLDAHDGFNPTKGHIGCAVVPALCALAEREPALAARDALTALAISYEIAARAALSLHGTVSDYHTSGAWNALGVAALGARLRNLDADRLRHALGIAEFHGPRSQMMREIANPTMLHDGSGMGAFTGLMAVLLAEDGFEGAPAITVEAEEVAERWSDLGRRWTVERNYIKPYPICRWAHGAIDALGQLMEEHGFAAHDVSAMNVNTFAEAAELFPGMPETTSQAQYSLAFALAALLVHGTIGPDQVTGMALSDPDIEAVVGKIRVSEAPRHSARFPEGRWADVTVRLSDGRTMSSGDVNAKGGPEAPLPRDAVKAKFLEMASGLGRDRAAAIWDMRDRMAQPGSRFADLLRLLHAPPNA
ncbi:MAG: MmgE/PrpD family protein [Boseongicola sp. SB0664_bin_43]|uniref:MmgE/PrpD family protein n=1 Tax=Boseongicola sp. SB0664_bin_43 TaxID=2604844 RepID=A0A6B0Y2U9_9RHOB|nr:MmgE/PrpD family protein [Boseongicola sp. SB0664_bin_43]